MSWTKMSDNSPEDEQWCWIYIPENVIVCACYDKPGKMWYIPGMDMNMASAVPIYWQPYYTPEAPDELD